jgi:hypothetical protein
MTIKRFAKWKRDGLRHYIGDYEMLKGLLDRVRVDLVRTGIIWYTLMTAPS